MALFAQAKDTRPRNSEIARLVEQLYAPDQLRDEALYDAYDNVNDFSSEHSIDDNLGDISALRQWACAKVKGTHLDPENRKPIQLSQTPLSDYNIEFTLNKTTDSITPSSLSSLVIPQASSASLSSFIATPNRPTKKNRKSSAPARRSDYTPSRILQENQKAEVDRRMTNFERYFVPNQFSTPVRSERTRASNIPRQTRVVDKGDTEPVVSSSNEHAREIDNEHRELLDRSDRTLTNENKATEPVSTSIIPETQPDDTVIPETQDVPESQPNNSVIPETQDVPESQDIIPETQEHEMPATQDEVANNPVQAQVTNNNTEQQAESRYTHLQNSSRRIQSRPPIHGQSQIATPVKYRTPAVPSTPTFARPIPKTPSRLPIPKTPSRLPVRTPIRTNALSPTALPIAVAELPRPNVGEVTSSNAEANRILVLHTPTNQTNQPATVPQTVIPAPNITVNVNVSNSQPQSPHQTTHTIGKHDQHIENATNAGNSGGDRRNSSVMTNDSDSNGNDANVSNVTNDTPKSDSSTSSTARRKLFVNNEAENTRPSATFTKVDNTNRSTDNLTRTIQGDTTHSTANGNQFRTRPKNSITNASVKSPNVPPNSQTFVKPRVSQQNATYDVPAGTQSRPSFSNQSRIGIDSAEFIHALEKTGNRDGSAMTSLQSGLADLPSEAVIDSIRYDDDDDDDNDGGGVDVDEVNDVGDLNNQNQHDEHDEPLNRAIERIIEVQKNTNFSPQVRLDRSEVRRYQDEHKTPSSNRFSVANTSNVRADRSYNIPPPQEFENSGDLEEFSPQTIRKRASGIIPIHDKPQNESTVQKTASRKSSKRAPKMKDPNITIVENNLKKLAEKVPAEKPRPRRLRPINSNNLNDGDEEDSVEHTEISTANSKLRLANENVFKTPDAPAPRKSKSTRVKKSISTSGTAQNMEESQDQEELVASVHIQPMDYDNDIEMDNHGGDNEASTSNQNEQRSPSPAPPSPKRKSKAQPKERANKTTAQANTTKKPARSKSKAKVPKATEEVEANDVTSTDAGCRRPRRAQIISNTYADIRRNLLAANLIMTEKRKLDAVHKTEPVISSRNDPESEPPRKKQRALSEIGRKLTRPSVTSQSVRSSNSIRGRKPSVSNESVTSSRQSARAGPSSATHSFDESRRKPDKAKTNNIPEFTKNFDVFMKKDYQQREQWWREIIDIEQKAPIINGVDEVDLETIDSKYGRMEMSATDKIAYAEKENVDYGFVPARSKRIGFMRFKPKAVKSKAPSGAELEMHVLRGEFILQHDEGEYEAPAGSDITIPQQATYGLVNCSDDVGLIHFTYAKM